MSIPSPTGVLSPESTMMDRRGIVTHALSIDRGQVLAASALEEDYSFESENPNPTGVICQEL